MNEPITQQIGDAGRQLCSSALLGGKRETPLLLPNDTKIRFCNGFHAMQKHLGNCDACCLYLYHGDGDLCEQGKAVIANEVAYSDTRLELPPNAEVSEAGPIADGKH